MCSSILRTMNQAAVLVICSIFATVIAQKNNNFIPGRNTIVHLFEWKWGDIARECEEFLAPHGYAGVQISPPSENQIIGDRPWWERYQPVSYELVTRSGDEAALADMIRRCNAVGVRIYVDVLLNDMAAAGGTGTAGNSCDPGSKTYPTVPYSTENFHASCPIDNYNDPVNIRNCELSGLKDLDQSQEHVRQKLVGYMNHLVDLGVAGFRVDAAKHMWPADLDVIYGSVKNLNTDHGFTAGSRPFYYQEVIDFGTDAVSRDEYTSFGTVLEFRYGKELSNSFRGHNALRWLYNWGTEWGLLDGMSAVAFIDNHDNQRSEPDTILTYKNPKPYKMAIAFMLAHPYGTTRVISSFSFDFSDQGPPSANGIILSPGFNSDNTCTNGWVCEHRWSQIYGMVGFRNAVEGTTVNNWWDNGDQQIAFSRGNKGFIAFTLNGDINQSLYTSLPPGNYCDIISGILVNGNCSGKTVTVDNGGNAFISLSTNEDNGVLAIHVNAKL